MLNFTGRTEVEAGRSPFGLKDEELQISFLNLEVAYIATRQVMLAKAGAVVTQGVPSKPKDGNAPVPHIGSPVKVTERN